MQASGDDRNQHAMLVEQAAGRSDHVGLLEPGHHLIGRESLREHPRRIQPHHVLAVLGADHLDPEDTRDAMKARNQVVERDVGELGQVAHVRTQAEIENREGSGAQQARVDVSAGRQMGARLRQCGAEQLEAGGRVVALGEVDVDLGAAARGGRAHQRGAGHVVGRFLQRARHCDQHLAGRKFGAVGEDDGAMEYELGEHRAGNRLRQDHAEHAQRDYGEQRQDGTAAAHRLAITTFCGARSITAPRSHAPRDHLRVRSRPR